jgi:hypothetical protein
LKVWTLLETVSQFGSAMSLVFFSKDAMSESAQTGVEMNVSPLPVYRKLTGLAMEAS